MPKIEVLSDILSNKIAAGEVVERPSSVVKELIENSLDAGASRIKIEIEAGGKKLIRITDNGEGMEREDATLAFHRHATSKLKSIDDLENINTFGFRGEALPSIASVSRVRLRTKTAAELEGTEVEIEGGRIISVRDMAWPGGTEFEVKDIFFNIPARHKFLKSDSTENLHITSLVTHYALANPHISFVFVNNGRENISVTPVNSLRERAYQLFGDDFIERLVEIEYKDEVVTSVRGFVSKPQEERASRDSQYLFVNNRFVRDRVINRAVTEAYKNILPTGSYPVVMLMIDIPSEEVDVNAHPAKLEVRFHHPYSVHKAVSNAIRAALTKEKPFAEFPTSNLPDTSSTHFASSTRSIETDIQQQNTNVAPINPRVNFELERNDWKNSFPEIPTYKPRLVDVSDPFDNSQKTETANRAEVESSSVETEDPFQIALDFTTDPEYKEQVSDSLVCPSKNIFKEINNGERLPGLEKIVPLGQLRDSFIVAIDSQGLMLIDQHVAHERILFEYHLKRVKSKDIEQQHFLIPETIDLTPSQAVAYDIVAQELSNNGFEVMRLSGRTVAIKSAPAMLSAKDARRLFLELVSIAEKEKRSLSLEDFQREISASLACHAAIKINMALTKEKMQWLIDELMKTETPTNCPHGRPIILRFSMKEIEKGFKRI
ncbi:MAG: DNA mismatch repair endonuclease MutL [Blastocatellia bacterium]|nr:DNA mismatch repair endonuclease MutL [Blastocatellia bacterium]